MYRDGKGVCIDYEQSMRWHIDSARQGNMAAVGNIITMYASGASANVEIFSEAFDILKKTAESGNIDAICRMGNLYYDGVGVSKDYAEALKWYQKSATLGHAWSKLRVGDMYRDGKGTQIDYEKSYFWYSK